MPLSMQSSSSGVTFIFFRSPLISPQTGVTTRKVATSPIFKGFSAGI